MIADQQLIWLFGKPTDDQIAKNCFPGVQKGIIENNFKYFRYGTGDRNWAQNLMDLNDQS